MSERVAAGESIRSVAFFYKVSATSVFRWARQKRATGSAAPQQRTGHKPRVLDRERGWLLDRIKAEPDVTLHELKAELVERGIRVSYGAVWTFVHRQGLSFKKACPGLDPRNRARGRARSSGRGGGSDNLAG